MLLVSLSQYRLILIPSVFSFIMFTLTMPITIFLKTMITLKDTYERESNNIHDVFGGWGTIHIKFIFFAHGLSGWETTDIIHEFGKTSILSKLKNSYDEASSRTVLLGKDLQDIGNSTIRVLVLRHSSNKL